MIIGGYNAATRANHGMISIFDAEKCEIVEQYESERFKFSAVGNQCTQMGQGKVIGLVQSGKDVNRVSLIQYMNGKVKILQKLGLEED